MQILETNGRVEDSLQATGQAFESGIVAVAKKLQYRLAAVEKHVDVEKLDSELKFAGQGTRLVENGLGQCAGGCARGWHLRR